MLLDLKEVDSIDWIVRLKDSLLLFDKFKCQKLFVRKKIVVVFKVLENGGRSYLSLRAC